MKVGIMQPYFLPYIGYWQLLNAVDEYVVYDDVNYINGGWINRNRILVNGKVQFFHLEMERASQNRLISDIFLHNGNWREKLCKTLDMAYHKAPFFSVVYPLLQELIFCEEKKLARYLIHSIRLICSYLHIQTKIHISSEFQYDRSLKGEARILNICKKLGADIYYNAIGGQHLYNSDIFRQHGIELTFIRTRPICYHQFSNKFEYGLSIIDVMMFCSKEEICDMLKRYDVLKC